LVVTVTKPAHPWGVRSFVYYVWGLRYFVLYAGGCAYLIYFLFLRTTLASGPAPAWELNDLNGKSVKLADFKGKVVILDFWATWCPPCRAEIPHFIELQNQYGAKGLQIVGISVDRTGVGSVAEFAKDQNINYPILMADQNVGHLYGDLPYIPTTFVIDPQGNIVHKHVGFTDETVFADEIRSLLPR